MLWAWLTVTLSLAAKDHFVSTGQEFAMVLGSVEPGDHIVLKNGRWVDARLNFRAKGKPGRPITLRAEAPGQVVFEGASQIIIDGPQLVVSGLKFQNNSNVSESVTQNDVRVKRLVLFTANSSDCRLTETAILDSGSGVTTYVHMQPGSFSNRVAHCFFSGQRDRGVTFYVEVHPTRPNFHLIESNYFGDRKPGRGNGWETMRIGHSAQQRFISGTTVAYNYFYRCNGELECISNKSAGNRYLRNAFIENQGQLTLRHGDTARIVGNYFFGGAEPAAQGVRISGSHHRVINNYFKGLRDALLVYNGQPNPEPTGYAAVSNTVIAANTFQDCSNTIVVGVGGRDRTIAPQDLRFVSNFVRSKADMIIQHGASPLEVEYEGNLMFGAKPGIDDHAGISTRPPATRTDPWGRLFPEDTGGSPLDAPSPKPKFYVSTDMDGNQRGTSSRPGALEGIRGPPRYPLSRNDVGPPWMKAQDR